MSQTLSEKIIAHASGKASVAPGEIVTCRVALAMLHDSSGPRRQQPMLDAIGARVWAPDRIVIISDHFVHERDPHSVRIQECTRDWVKANGVRRFHDAEGICHIVLPERGYVRPGMFAVGADSHSPTAGAFGCFMIGLGATDMTGVLATGEVWVRVPASIKIEASGVLGRGVAAKDVALSLCRRLGINGANYRAVEFTGSAVDALSMDERMVLTNMSAELGAKTGIIAADATTMAWLREADAEGAECEIWQSDEDAVYEQVIDVDAGALAPQVAAPHSPANTSAVEAHAGVAVHQAYIGACTGAKLADLRMAAEIVKARKAAAGTRFMVAPASRRIHEQAAAEGTLATLEAAGAVILPAGCGGCIGLGAARLAEGEVGIASSSRNFKGRMGPVSSRSYLASPYTVAAAAVTGQISDPRVLLER